MSTPETPNTYSSALDRVLDGLGADPGAGPEAVAAHAEASADVAALRRALGLIGDALAADSASVAVSPIADSASVAVSPIADSASVAFSPIAEGAPVAAAPVATGGATVVPLATWRSRLRPRVLAAAASLAFVVGVGIPVALSVGGGSGEESTISAGAPLDAAESAQERSGLPDGAAAGAAADAAATESESTAGALTPPEPLPPFSLGKDAPAGEAAAADESAAQTAPQVAAPVAGQTTAYDGFRDAAGCARAIMIGAVTAITPTEEPGQVTLTVTVGEWISPPSGPPVVSYVVTGPVAITTKGEEELAIGDRRLFVIPGMANDVVRTFRQPEWEAARERIARVQEQGNADCS
ncbi:MAG: hypothetical protein ACT4PP_11065 [Sporichthyaceae bacterium]